MKEKVISLTLAIILTIFSVGMLSFFVKGKPGNPLKYQYDYGTEVGSPFESSNTTSRYILTESIVTTGQFLLDEKQARFAAPDVVFYKNTFFSIFTPGVSFLAIPLYVVGQYFHAPQLFSFFTTLIFGLINLYLVALLATKFGANRYLGAALGLTFLFGTNALAYVLTLTQHHYSVTVILLGLLNVLVEKRTFWNNIVFGLLFTSGLLIDIPNGFMMLPLAIYLFVKHFEITQKAKALQVFINPVGFWVIVGMIPLMVLFGYYNKHTAGSETVIGQNIGQSDYFDSAEKKEERALEKLDDTYEPIKTPFNTRKQLSGFYILLTSDERGIFYYNTIIILGMLGLFFAYKKHTTLVSLGASIILINVVLYSAFGDAWGGWSFGPRYLIPSVAILVSAIGGLAVFSGWRKYVVAVFFLVTLLYGVYITTAASLTTNAIPPKVEAEQLDTPLPYTYQYNFDLLNANKSSSLLYETYFSNSLSLAQLHVILFSVLSVVIFGLFGFGMFVKGGKK